MDFRGSLRTAVLALLVPVILSAGLTLVPSTPAGATTVSVPSTPAGDQVTWLLGVSLPLSAAEVDAHFDAPFLLQVHVAALNSVLESLAATGPLSLVSLAPVSADSINGVVAFGTVRYSVSLTVDARGLIAGMLFKPLFDVPTTWGQIEQQLAGIAPDVGLLVARVKANGDCSVLQSVDPKVQRPTGSMFKLFVLGALANAVAQHRVSWNQKLTVTAAVKVGGSGTVQDLRNGTKLTVLQVAVKMISVSDNTAADMLIALVGRSAVDAQVSRWVAHPASDIPFLTVKELFALKYSDNPALANAYLATKPSAKAAAAFLSSRVDKVATKGEQGSTTPRDIGSIEWFASPADLCRAFTGLQHLQTQSGLGQLNTVLSTNTGGIPLNPAIWPRIWFKGGSEPGVLTLGYLARDHRGRTYVVVAMTENTTEALSTNATTQLVAIVAGAFDLLQ